MMRYKLLITGLLCTVWTGAVHAAFNADELGKLFTDKKQRARIDAARSGDYATPSAQKTNKVRVSGYMKRSNGKSVVWVNDENTLDSTTVGDIRVHRAGLGKDNRVTISVDGKVTRLKPGESWDKETGEIIDNQ
ncbi:MAG TPA: hypothetical protein ENJ87_03360 [Gammaproteobacteria bacterium]|nr:hypothetical protein [Gammaproteobacteria bacterium]